MQLRVLKFYNNTLYDEVLDLYKSEPIRINMQVEEFLKAEPATDFTNSFRIPSTERNNNIFRNLFEINGLDFDITQRITAYLQYDDGSIFKKGQLRLLKIYYSENNKADYDCVFLGLQRDFFAELGDTTLCQLDMSDLAHQFSLSEVETSWEAYPNSTDLNAGLLNGDILYPLIDFGDEVNSDGTLTDPSFDISNPNNFTVNAASLARLKPMIRARQIINKIFEHVNFTYESDLFDDPTFLRLYVSAFGNRAITLNENATLDTWIVSTSDIVYFYNFVPYSFFYDQSAGEDFTWVNINNLNVGIPIDWYFPFVSSDNLVDFNNNNNNEGPLSYNFIGTPAQEDIYNSDQSILIVQQGELWGTNLNSILGYPYEANNINRYEFPTDGDYRVTMNFKMVINCPNGVEGLFIDTPSNSSMYSLNLTSSIGVQFGESITAPIPADAWTQIGPTLYLIDYDLDVLYEGIEDYLLSVYLSGIPLVNTNYGTNVWAYMPPAPANRITVEKEISTAAGYETTIQSSFDCEYKAVDFLKDIMGKFRLMLIPDKLIENKMKVIPWKDYIGSGTLRDWTDKLDVSKDIMIEPLFGNKSQRMEFSDKADGDFYNKLNVETFGESFGALTFDSGIEIIKGVEQIESNFSPTISTQVRGYDGTDASNFIIPQIYNNEYKPTKPKTRLLFYNGKQPIDISYRLAPVAGNIGIYNEYPKVSNLSTPEPNFTSFDINWQREAGYAQPPASTSLDGLSAYDVFWKDYIELIYSKESRRVVAYIYLTPNDIKDFEFNDVIFIKGVYYFVEKIEGVEIDRAGSYKCTLIKLLNYDYNIQTSANVWNTTNINWDVIQDNWND